MNRVLLIVCFWGLYPIIACSQTDTIYKFYDTNWKEVANLETAEYKRSAYRGEDGLWHVRDFYKNGQLQMSGSFTDQEMEQRHGPFECFHPNGKLKRKAIYSNGTPIGEDLLYYENGQLDSYSKFDAHGKLLEEVLYKTDGSKSVIEPAEFPGGMKNMYRYIKKNSRHPARTGKGKVVISFVVNVDGSLGGIEILEWSAREFVYEATRIVETMPKWKPAMRDQTPIPMRYNLPIVFHP